MFGFGKKVDNTKVEESLTPNLDKLLLYANDDMSTRAYKIWTLMGMGNDRFGFVERMALYLYVYRDLDLMQDSLDKKEESE